MSGAAASPQDDPHQLGRGSADRQASGRGDGGPASKRIATGYGFWIFLLSDIILFSGFFAAFAVLRDQTAGGPSGPELFELKQVGIETVVLLFSSFACGLAGVATLRQRAGWTQIALLITGLLGFVFLLLELKEFATLIGEGAGPARSAFLSAFFALVGCHGLHVGAGILWCGTMMAQLWSRGFLPSIQRRLMCFFLFWHALDIVWVALFTMVYLLGVAP